MNNPNRKHKPVDNTGVNVSVPQGGGKVNVCVKRGADAAIPDLKSPAELAFIDACLQERAHFAWDVPEALLKQYRPAWKACQSENDDCRCERIGWTFCPQMMEKAHG